MSAVSSCITLPSHGDNSRLVKESAVWRRLAVELREINEAYARHPENSPIRELLHGWLQRFDGTMRFRQVPPDEIIGVFRGALEKMLQDLLVSDPLTEYLFDKMSDTNSLFFSDKIKGAREVDRRAAMRRQMEEIDALCRSRIEQTREAVSHCGSLIDRIRQFSQEEQAGWDALQRDSLEQLSQTNDRIQALRERIRVRREEKQQRIAKLKEEVQLLKQEIVELGETQKNMDVRIETLQEEQKKLQVAARELEQEIEQKKDEALKQLALTVAIAIASWGVGKAIGMAVQASGNSVTVGPVWKF